LPFLIPPTTLIFILWKDSNADTIARLDENVTEIPIVIY